MATEMISPTLVSFLHLSQCLWEGNWVFGSHLLGNRQLVHFSRKEGTEMTQTFENSIHLVGTMGEQESYLFGGSILTPHSAPFLPPD